MNTDDHTLQSAVNSAMDNLPPGYELSVAFKDGLWRVQLLRPSGTHIWGFRQGGPEGMGLTWAIVRAIDSAREAAFLPN